MLSPWNNRLDTIAYYNENDRNSRYHRLYRQVPNQKFDQSLLFSLQSAKFNLQVYLQLLATVSIFDGLNCPPFVMCHDAASVLDSQLVGSIPDRALGIVVGGRSGTEQEINARLALLVEANLFLEMQQSSSMPSHEVKYLRSHFRSQSDAWLSRLKLEEEAGMLENQSGICQRTYVRTLRRQRHRLHQLARESIIDESTVQKLERELDMEESRLTSVTRKT